MKKKIVFFQVGPGIGPITNNNFRFARALLPQGMDVELLGTEVDGKVYDAAPEGMKITSLEAPSFRYILKPLIRYLKKTKPDVLLASGPTLHVLACIAKRVTGHPETLVLRIHAHTTSLLSDRSYLNRKVLLTLMRLTHKWSEFKVSPSRGAADDWAHLLGIPVDKVKVMYNPAVDEDLLIKCNQPVDHPWFNSHGVPVIITVARLSPEKSLDVLLEAFSLVVSKKSARLIILGEGPLREKLQKMAQDLEISELVDFHGWVENPFAFMSKADLFVLSSWYEGFANVIAEALACGCPVVSTDAPSGPSEILDGGKFGRLVPVGNVSALSKAMVASLTNPPDRDSLKQRGMQFHVNRVVSDAKDVLGVN